MRQFNIKVNGKMYEVEVEEIRNGVVVNTPAPAPASAPVAPAAKPAAAAPAKSGTAGSAKVASPMPGTILDIKVKPGDKVKSGDVLLVLEAMKMENEIVAPSDATVASIETSVGASVNTGDVLVTLN